MPSLGLSARVKPRLGVGRRNGHPLPCRELFPQDLIVHFSYHKCISYYYDRILKGLRDEFGFYFQTFGRHTERFNTAAVTHPGKRILTLNGRDDINWEQFPRYKGSHFIRDPRDLVVSGYHYHMWTQEAWCRKPNFGWPYFTAMPEFRFVESDPARFPRAESYQEYLNTLNPESGMILEMLWRKVNFDQMRRWNYHNSDVLEMRYEEIVGNERAAFERLFTHYAFHPLLLARGLELAELFSLKNQPRGERDHMRSGELRQWEKEFTPHVRAVFKAKYGELLIHLRYERDQNW